MEYWDIYDKNGHFAGKVIEKGAKLLPGEYHKAVEIWIINQQQEFLLQKRSDTVELYPGFWALTTGRLQSGEDPQSGCLRELREELGISLETRDLHPIAHVVRPRASMIWDIFLIEWNGTMEELSFSDHEVADVRWVTADEMLHLIRDKKIFTYPEIEDVFHAILQKYGASSSSD